MTTSYLSKVHYVFILVVILVVFSKHMSNDEILMLMMKIPYLS